MQYIFSILPLLACPLMMGVMMWMMMRGNSGQGNQGQDMNTTGQDRMAPMATRRRDSGEIVANATPIERTRDEQVAELRTRLSRLQTQQQAIATQMAELDTQEEFSRNV